jgi:hypothetical protein
VSSLLLTEVGPVEIDMPTRIVRHCRRDLDTCVDTDGALSLAA